LNQTSNNTNNTVYTTSLGIGTPAQNFSFFAYDTRSFTTYVGNRAGCVPNCSPNLFFAGNSSTFKSNGSFISQQYNNGSISASGSMNSDNFTFGNNITAPNTSFLLASNIINGGNYDGVLALGYNYMNLNNYSPNGTSTNLNIMSSLLSGGNGVNDIFVQRLFPNNTGYLYLGGIPADIVNNVRAVCSIYPNAVNWACNITQILIRNQSSNDWSTFNAYTLRPLSSVTFATMNYHVYAPNETLNYFLYNIPQLNNTSVCNMTVAYENGKNALFCAKNSTFNVTNATQFEVDLLISNYALRINATDLFTSFNTTHYIFNILFHNDNTTSEFVAGNLFLKNYDVIFNGEFNQIEFNGNYYNYSAGQVLMFILIGVGCLVGIGIVILTTCYCCRRTGVDDKSALINQ